MLWSFPKPIKAGIPWSWTTTFKDAKNIWPTLAGCEIRAQLRVAEDTTSRLIANLHEKMTLAFSGNDIVVSWVLTGADTRALYSQQWGANKTGFVTMILSDAGTTDARALEVPTFQLNAEDTTTTAAGDI